MPALDHTKSLAAYKDILETFERDYRDSSTDQRPHIMDAISGSIAAGAEEQGATILSGDALEKQIIHWYSNHRSTPKGVGDPAIPVGKKWTTRLMVDHLHHDEIEKQVNALGPLNPHERIAKWASTVTLISNALNEEDRRRYTMMAERWNAEGPPKEIKRREAKEKTGKYVVSFLEHLKRHLGIHAVVLVAYQNPEMKIKISDFETTGLKDQHQFRACCPEEFKELRGTWGTWAKEKFAETPSADEDDEGEPTDVKVVPPEIRFLESDAQGMWELGPLPELGTVRHIDVANALHSLMTQRWRIGGGVKNVKWKDVKAHNPWYISKEFLLPGKTFYNPTRMPEAAVRAYWKMWYGLAQSNTHFAFLHVGSYPGGDSMEKESTGMKKMEVDSEDASDNDSGPKELKVPKDCRSDENKIAFLRSLLPSHFYQYHTILKSLALLEDESESIDIQFTVKCFSWKWNSIHSDRNLHTEDSAELEALVGWLDEKPHLLSTGELVNKATLLRICLGLGILLNDAILIQYTEDGGHAEDTPGYIVQSAWRTPEEDKFAEYIRKVKTDLVGPDVKKGWKKRKASLDEAAPANQLSKKAAGKARAAKEDETEGSAPAEDPIATVSARPKPKKTTRASNTQPILSGGSDREDKGEGTSKAGLRKSTRVRKESSKYLEYVGAGGKNEQTGGQGGNSKGSQKTKKQKTKK